MRKTLFGAMAAAMAALLMPGNVAAQEKMIAFPVRTFDNAAVVGARIYAGTAGVNYFVDSLHLHPAYQGAALPMDSLVAYKDLNVAPGGHAVSGSADSTLYAEAFIVVADAGGHFYVLGDVADRDSGIVRTQHLFDGIAAGDTLGTGMAPLNVAANMLMMPRIRLRDNHADVYGSLAAAVANPLADTVFFLDTVVETQPIDINRDMIVLQQGLPMESHCTGDFIRIANATVGWDGGGSGLTSDSPLSCPFTLAGGSLAISRLNALSATTLIKMDGISSLFANGGTFTTTAAGEAIVIIKGQGTASIGNVSFSGGQFAVSIGNGSEGRLLTTDQTVNTYMAGYRIPINAYGYTHNGIIRTYRRTLKLAAADDDTVYLARTMPAGIYDTIANPVALRLGGDSIMSSLHIMHSRDTVSISGGVIDSLTGSADSAVLVLHGLDSVGTVAPGGHTTAISSGRYGVLAPASGAAITLTGGKFANEYANYLAPRHTIIPNTDAADSAAFPFRVVPGHKVLYVNYDCNGRDTLIVYNEADGMIRPVLSSPRYPGSDTLFVAWYTDSLYTSPWLAGDYELTQDTVLYARWQIVGSHQYRYTVSHYFIGLNPSVVELHDRVTMAADSGSIVTVAINSYPGRHCITPADSLPPLPLLYDGMEINFRYALDTFYLTWDANGGLFPDLSASKTDTLCYTQPVSIPAAPHRTGHIFDRWIDPPATMPDHSLTVMASYLPRICQLTWTGADTVVTYTASPVTGISASYKDDDSNLVQAALTFIATDFTESAYAVKAGTYRVVAAPRDGGYYLSGNNSTTLTITPAPLTVRTDNMAYEAVKFYDGSNAVRVSQGASLSGVLGNDDVQLGTVASYSDAATGTGKAITAQFSITGADTPNYSLATTSAVLTTSGAILDSINLDGNAAENGIALDAFGYCSGSDTIRYYLRSGNPDEYSITFSDSDIADQHFANTGWTMLDPTTPGVIIIDVPADAASGDYTVALRFRDSRYPDMVSDPTDITFHVNLPRTYTMPLFSDVIALVDTCQCFSDIQWYHNGVAIPGATGRYYQEAGGLTGQYHVTARMNGQPTATCVQDDMATLIADDAAVEPVVTIYPNPTADRVTVSIDGGYTESHTVRVMTITGAMVDNAVFTGSTATLDFSRYGNGSYTVIVDGIVSRVIKK